MPDKSIKIVYFGTSDFAVPSLRYLIQNGYNIIAVVTQPEKPAGRLRVEMPSPVKKVAVENKIPVFEPHSLKKDEDFLKHFKHLNPDICIVSAYGKIIPESILEIPRYGFLNIHPSLLPKYRGPSPIQNAIMNGDEETGVAIMKVDAEMDHGPILKAVSCKLKAVSYKDAETELAELGGELLLEVLPKYLSGEIKPQEQDHAKAIFVKLLTRDDGRIDWNRTAREIFNQIRALNPEPGTWTTWQGKVFNIKSADVLEAEAEGNPGEVVKVNNLIAVKTKKCYLILKQIQLEGGKEMDAKSFLNGHSDFLGSRLE